MAGWTLTGRGQQKEIAENKTAKVAYMPPWP
jgi:hypothetical protein